MAVDKGTRALVVTLIKSPIARLPKHKACLKALGLKRLHQTRKVPDTPTYRGLVNQVSYLLHVEVV